MTGNGELSDRARTTPHGGGFELTLCGSELMLSLVPGPGGELPSAGEVIAAANDAPVDAVNCAVILSAMRQSPGSPVCVGSVEFPADACWVVKVSPSRMAAFAVPVMSEGVEPPVITSRELRLALGAAGVTSGVVMDTVDGFRDGRRLDQPVLVARGTPAASGQSSHVEFTFEDETPVHPSELDDGSIDFHSLSVQRFVDTDAVLARRTPAILGKPGRDVTGKVLPVAAVRDFPLERNAGKGTRVEGETIVAAQPGRPVLANERVEVLTVYDVKGDLDFSVGNIDFVGDVIIHGDIHPGFLVHATGTVTVQGIVDRATVIAGQDVIARAITGDEHVHVEAGRDVVAQYLHNVRVVAAGTVRVQKEVLHCQVDAARVQIPGGGRIVGGHVYAKTEIAAGVLGSVQAVPTHLEVGGGSKDARPVIRAAKKVYFGSIVRVAHEVGAIDDDLGPSSFWTNCGEVVRLDASSTGPDTEQRAA